MKVNFFIAVLLMLGSRAYSQHNNAIIGAELDIPSGNSSNISGVGYGGYVKGEVGLSQKFSLTATGSINSFLGKKFLGIRSQTLTYLPVRLGLKYYPSEDAYFEGQVGASFPVRGDSKTSLTWSPGVGTFVKTKDGNKLDLSLRYEVQTSSIQYLQTSTKYSSFGYIGLRFGYVFGS